MRVLVTGGFGLIGGRLGQHLRTNGHDVILGSRRRVPPPDWLPEAKTVVTIWESREELERICRGADVVVHAAGMNAEACASDPVHALNFNGVATARLAVAAAASGVRRLVYLSSAHIYASPLAGNINEATCPRNLHPYATSHRAGEDAVLNIACCGGMDGLTLRLSNAYGAPAHKSADCWKLLVNDLCRQAVETGKLVLRSSGGEQRDFVGIGEVCRAIEYLIAAKLNKDFPRVLNVGAGLSRTIVEMAGIVRARCKTILGFEPVLLRSQYKAGEVVGSLIYETYQLQSAGLILSNDPNDEVDRLLQFCDAVFMRNSKGNK